LTSTVGVMIFAGNGDQVRSLKTSFIQGKLPERRLTLLNSKAVVFQNFSNGHHSCNNCKDKVNIFSGTRGMSINNITDNNKESHRPINKNKQSVHQELNKKQICISTSSEHYMSIWHAHVNVTL
jgi:hypothetical protein